MKESILSKEARWHDGKIYNEYQNLKNTDITYNEMLDTIIETTKLPFKINKQFNVFNSIFVYSVSLKLYDKFIEKQKLPIDYIKLEYALTFPTIRLFLGLEDSYPDKLIAQSINHLGINKTQIPRIASEILCGYAQFDYTYNCLNEKVDKNSNYFNTDKLDLSKLELLHKWIDLSMPIESRKGYLQVNKVTNMLMTKDSYSNFLFINNPPVEKNTEFMECIKQAEKALINARSLAYNVTPYKQVLNEVDKIHKQVFMLNELLSNIYEKPKPTQ